MYPASKVLSVSVVSVSSGGVGFPHRTVSKCKALFQVARTQLNWHWNHIEKLLLGLVVSTFNRQKKRHSILVITPFSMACYPFQHPYAPVNGWQRLDGVCHGFATWSKHHRCLFWLPKKLKFFFTMWILFSSMGIGRRCPNFPGQGM